MGGWRRGRHPPSVSPSSSLAPARPSPLPPFSGGRCRLRSLRPLGHQAAPAVRLLPALCQRPAHPLRAHPQGRGRRPTFPRGFSRREGRQVRRTRSRPPEPAPWARPGDRGRTGRRRRPVPPDRVNPHGMAQRRGTGRKRKEGRDAGPDRGARAFPAGGARDRGSRGTERGRRAHGSTPPSLPGPPARGPAGWGRRPPLRSPGARRSSPGPPCRR
jgi:hypothetical protein